MFPSDDVLLNTSSTMMCGRMSALVKKMVIMETFWDKVNVNLAQLYIYCRYKVLQLVTKGNLRPRPMNLSLRDKQ